MTCIAGIAEGGAVWIAGDSAGVDDRYHLVTRTDRKVFRNGPFVIGFTSSFRMGQLLAYVLKPPCPRVGVDVMAFMVTDFVDAVRDCLKDGGFARKKDGEETGGAFLVGYAGRLFQIEEDYQVGESTHGFAACGCGDLIALGALHASTGLPPYERLARALAAAETFSGGVRAPFHVELLQPELEEPAP